MRAWWRGTSLVAERRLVENIRSRSFKVLTGLLLLLSIAAVTIPQILSRGGTKYTIATTGKAPAALVAALDAAGRSADFSVKYVSRADASAVRLAVRDGDATAGLAGGTLFTSATSAGTFPFVVAQTVVGLETARRLSEAGLSPQQVAALQSIRPPKTGRRRASGQRGAGRRRLRRRHLNRDILVNAASAHGLQPVRQVSIDDTWSALRFRPSTT